MAENNLKNYILTAIIIAILTVASATLSGVVGLLFFVLLSAVIGYTVTKHHYSLVLVSCVLTIAIYGFFAKMFSASFFSLIPIILCGISLGISHNMKLSEFKTLCVVGVINVFYLVLNMKFTGIAETLEADIMDVLSSSFSLYEGQMSQADFNTLTSTFLSMFMTFMPSFIIIFCMCYSFLFLLAFKSVLKITKSDMSHYVSLSQWHAEKSLCVLFVLITAVGFMLPAGNMFSDAILNVVFVSTFIFFLYGFSLLSFLLKKRMSNNLFRKALLILILTFTLPFFGLPYIAICIGGVLDGFVDFRKKFEK